MKLNHSFIKIIPYLSTEIFKVEIQVGTSRETLMTYFKRTWNNLQQISQKDFFIRKTADIEITQSNQLLGKIMKHGHKGGPLTADGHTKREPEQMLSYR